jgi:hypothetical protein
LSNVGIYFKDVAIGIAEEDGSMTPLMVGDWRDQFDTLGFKGACAFCHLGRRRAATLRSRVGADRDAAKSAVRGRLINLSAHPDRFRQANARASGSSMNNVIETAPERFRS